MRESVNGTTSMTQKERTEYQSAMQWDLAEAKSRLEACQMRAQSLGLHREYTLVDSALQDVKAALAIVEGRGESC